MMGALISLCTVAIGARELSGEIDLFQVLFFRSVIGLGLISFLIYRSKGSILYTTSRLKMHVGRNVFHFGGQYGWFLGIGLLPLAEVFAIEFTAPVWTVLIAAVFLKEPLTARKLCAVLLGLVGVYVILDPSSGFNGGSLVVLAASVCFAISYSFTKSLSDTESPLTILFYMCLVQLPMGLLLVGSNWVMPNIAQWFWISIIGLAALSAHYCITRALILSDAGVVITLDFLRLPLIAVIGVLFYSEDFDITLLIGAAIMLLGNLINVLKTNK